MNKLIEQFEKRAKEIKLEYDIMTEAQDLVLDLLDGFPEDVLETKILWSSFYPFQYDFEDTERHISLTLYFPFIPKNINKIKTYFKENEFQVSEHDSFDKSDLHMYATKYLNDHFYFKYEISFKGDSPASTCILVPLQQEKEIIKKVKVYDRICPDTHPDLFKKNENGDLVYIGDNVFPALEE